MIKIGIRNGDVDIIIVGGELNRFEYLVLGKGVLYAINALNSLKEIDESQVACSEEIYYMIKSFIVAIKIENDIPPLYKPDNGKEKSSHEYLCDYYQIIKLKTNRLQVISDSYKIRSQFNIDKLRRKISFLSSFMSNSILKYIELEKESWSNEIRYISCMNLLLKLDLFTVSEQSGIIHKLHDVIKKIQINIYSTKGSLVKISHHSFGINIIACWGLPFFSHIDDYVNSVFGAILILEDMKKENIDCHIGLSTAYTFIGVIGNVGNRKEYSPIGDALNISYQLMLKSIQLNFDENQKESSFTILIDEKTNVLSQNKIDSVFIATDLIEGYEVSINIYSPKEIKNLTPNPTNPFPYIRTHKYNCICNISGPSQIDIDANKFLLRSHFMIGRSEELNYLLNLYMSVYENKTKEIIVLKGVVGSGKSLLIRRSLYEFFNKNQEIKRYYKGISSNPLILCDFQTPFSIKKPFNGIVNLLLIILNRIKSINNKRKVIKTYINNKMIEIECDPIGEIVCNKKYINIVNIISQIITFDWKDTYRILNNNEEFIMSSAGKTNTLDFLNEIYNLNKLTNQKHNSTTLISNLSKISKVNESNEILNQIISLFIDIIILYKSTCIDMYNESLPLFIILEDCHLVDIFTCKFISLLIRTNKLSSTMVICSYQTPLSQLLSFENDKFSKQIDLFTLKSIILGPLFEYEDIFQLIKENIKYKYNITIEKIERKLVYILVSKAFNGIPMFIIDFLEAMIQSSRLIQFIGNELMMTNDLEEMEKIQDWSEFEPPYLTQKICISVIDTLPAKVRIILMIASVIGNIFDIEKLYQLIPFNNISFDQLVDILTDIESKNLIEVLYNLNQKYSVYKFSFPFIREVLYQKMTIQKRKTYHINLARSLQEMSFTYREPDIYLSILKNHLIKSERTIEYYFNKEINNINANLEKSNENEDLILNSMSTSNLKIYFFNELITKMKWMFNKKDERNLLVQGKISKKSENGIVWEERFCGLSRSKFQYWYFNKDHKHNLQPLGQFNVKDIIKVEMTARNRFESKNVFLIEVKKWMKKEIIKSQRVFYLSVDSNEDLIYWLTAFNFLCLNSYYEQFTSNYCFISFPYKKILNLYERKYKLEFKINNNNYTIDNSRMYNNKNQRQCLYIIDNKYIIDKINYKKEDYSTTKKRQGIYIETDNNEKKRFFEMNFLDILPDFEIENTEKIGLIKNLLSSNVPFLFTIITSVIQDKIFNTNNSFYHEINGEIKINDDSLMKYIIDWKSFSNITIENSPKSSSFIGFN